MMQRRRLWQAGLGLCIFGPAAAGLPLALRAREGGVLLVRHADTEPGIGDPPGFALGQCATQRNLSERGRAQARAMGQWFERHGLRPQAVLSSQWCRCQDTARIALGQAQDWWALNSTFAGQGQPEDQRRALHERLLRLAPGVLEVWVTHQLIITDLTGAYPAMAEGFVLRRPGQWLARGMMTPDV